MLKFLFILIISFLVPTTGFSFAIDGTVVNCKPSVACHDFQKAIRQLETSFHDLEHFLKIFKLFISDGEYESLSYQLVQRHQKIILEIDVKNKPLIKSVTVRVDEKKDPYDLTSSIRSKAGGYFNLALMEDDEETLRNKMNALGFPDSVVKFSQKNNKLETIDILYGVKKTSQRILTEMTYECKNSYVESMLPRYFDGFKNKFYNRDRFNAQVNQIRKDLYDQGFYFIKINFRAKEIGENIHVNFGCEDAERVFVDFKDDNEIFEKEDIHTQLQSVIQKSRLVLLAKEVERFVTGLYQDHGFLNPQVQVNRYVKEGEKDYSETLFIHVLAQKRHKLKKITLKGNNFVSNQELLDLYSDNAFDLASRGYYDPQYYKEYLNLAKKFYINKGYLTADIQFQLRSMTDRNFDLLFEIHEGRKTFVKNFKIYGISSYSDIGKLVNEKFVETKEGKVFNPIFFEQEMISFLQKIKEMGYFSAYYSTKTDSEILTYSNSQQEVDIHLHLNIGHLHRLNRTIVAGTVKTRPNVIIRKIKLEKNELITPTLIDQVRGDIASMGIFSSYEVYPIEGEMVDGVVKTDLLIKIQERDFGTIDLAPGFRNDLGLKLSSRLTLMNLMGLNQTTTINGAINKRTTMRNFDKTRQEQGDEFIEYDLSVNHSYPDFMETYWDYLASVSTSKRRFYSFDADIMRVSNTFSKDLTRRFSFSLRHQYETIDQFNATLKYDNGNFKIGALTPSITYDLRDSQIQPRKGAYFNLSTEVAKPIFLSQDDPDYRIDFYKVISRNRFYVPFSQNLILAMSITAGMQENLANGTLLNSNGNPIIREDKFGETTVLREGAIPSIKVFRLTGVDQVRGFSEDEINRVEDGRDISEVLVQDKAYMTNIKIEPRYFVNDQMSVGVFYDAGSVQTHTYDPLELRDAAGVTFKFLTPVGSLDFDYGIKLLRKKMPDGTLESPGRVHISIGFF